MSATGSRSAASRNAFTAGHSPARTDRTTYSPKTVPRASPDGVVLIPATVVPGYDRPHPDYRPWSDALGPLTDELRCGAAAVHERLECLTRRERDVLGLVALGLSNDEIAERLFVSPLTAKTHVNRAMSKLAARDRAQLVVIAYQCGVVSPATTATRPPGAG